jgi:hypothetical protein
MITATLRRMPTNYTDNFDRTFPDLETAIRTIRKMDIILVRLEEENVGWHKVALNKDGGAYIHSIDYSVPTGGKMHYSEKYKEIEERIREEERNPKLA